MTLDRTRVTARTFRTEAGTTHTVYRADGQTYFSREQLDEEVGPISA